MAVISPVTGEWVPGEGSKSGKIFNLEGQTKTYYVRTTGGDDENDGLTAGTAFLTYERMLKKVEKDYFNGSYIIDITGCTFDEPIRCPQIRSRASVHAVESQGPDYRGPQREGALNFRAIPTELTTDFALASPVETDRDQTITISGAAWTVDQWKGKFLRGNIGGWLVPIISNTADTLHIPLGCSTTLGNGNIVEPSAVVRVADGSTAFDSVDAGVVWFGVRFTRQDLSTQAVIFTSNGMRNLVFEGCVFGSAGAAYKSNLIRLSGNGLTKFFINVFEDDVAFDLVSGGLVVHEMAHLGSLWNDMGSGTDFPLTKSIEIKKSWAYNWGIYQSAWAQPTRLLMDRVGVLTGFAGEWTDTDGYLVSVFIGASLNIGNGCNIRASGIKIVNNLVLAAGATFYAINVFSAMLVHVGTNFSVAYPTNNTKFIFSDTVSPTVFFGQVTAS